MSVNSDTDGELATEPENELLPPANYGKDADQQPLVTALVNPETIVPKAQLTLLTKGD